MTGRNLDASSTFEEMCVAFEQAYAQDPTGLLCECCQAAGCESCKHALGWHVCQRDRDTCPGNLRRLEEPPEKWKAGTLHAGKLDMESNLWFLARRRVPLDVLKDKLDVYIADGHIRADENIITSRSSKIILATTESSTCVARKTLQERQQQRSLTTRTK